MRTRTLCSYVSNRGYGFQVLGAGECTALRLVGGVRTMLRAAFFGELDHHRIRTVAIVTLPGSNRV